MKTVFKLFLACIALTVFSSVAYASEPTAAEKAETITVVYSGDFHGKLLPTKICGGQLAGGLSRRMTVLEQFREKNQNLLYIDNGGFFAVPARKNQELRARVGLEVMDFMGLDVMNLGQREFYFGPDYLTDKAKKHSFPFISTNIVAKPELPWLKKYIIKEVGGHKVAILGVLPVNSFSYNLKPSHVRGLSITNPEEAVKETLAEIGNQAEIIILLSQLSEEQTSALMEKTPGIHLAVAHSNKKTCEAPISPSQIIVPSGVNGQFFLSANIALTNGTVKVSQNPPTMLDDSVDHFQIVDKMITVPFKEQRKKEKTALKAAQNAQNHPNATVIKQMTPEEFFEAVNKKKAELKKLRPEPEGEEIGATLKFDGKEVPATIRVIRDKNVPKEGQKTEIKEEAEVKEETAQ